MQVRAALAVEAGKPLEVTTVDLDGRRYVEWVRRATDPVVSRPDAPLPGPRSRSVELIPEADGVAFDARWTWTAAEPVAQAFSTRVEGLKRNLSEAWKTRLEVNSWRSKRPN